MKKLIILFSLVLTLFTSCSDDLLVETPQTFISSGAFYKTEADFNAALVGIYSDVRSIAAERSLRDLFSENSDLPESAESTLGIWKNNPTSNMWDMRYGWGIPYSIINNSNLILRGLETAEIPQSAKNEIEGEAKCLRAYAYFQLVQFFGDIPLRISPAVTLSETSLPKSSQEEVYNLIISDLSFAESNLPALASVEGRVYKLVATALLAKVYLVTAGFPLEINANYGLAKTKAMEVIAAKPLQITDYAQVFHNNKYTSESIWEAFVSPPSIGNNLHTLTAPTGNSTAMLLPTNDFINSFPNGDRRKEWGIKDGYTNALGNQIVKRTYYNKFINEQFFEAELSPSTAAISLDYTMPIIRTAEMYLIAAEAENEMSGPTAVAYDYINAIRQRARIDKNDRTHVPNLSGLSKDVFRTAVLNERKWELFIEGQAWFDLKRTQTFNLVQLARGSQMAVPIGTYNNTWLISDFEILNNNIEQNPTYGN